jgi:hypothetical protein
LDNRAIVEHQLKRFPRKGFAELQSGMGVAVRLAKECFDKFLIRGSIVHHGKIPHFVQEA